MSTESQPRKEDAATQQIAREAAAEIWRKNARAFQFLTSQGRTDSTARIILSAIERAREEWMIESKAQIESGADQPAQPQRSEQQELLWSEAYVDERLGRDASWPQIIEAVNYSINAALAAERKRIGVLERAIERRNTAIDDHVMVGRKLAEELAAERDEVGVRGKSITQLRDRLAAERQRREQAERWLDEKREESAMFAADASKYHAQLLSTLAAIEAHNKIWTVQGRDFSAAQINDVDLSLLHKHDAEVSSFQWQSGFDFGTRQAKEQAAEARKPLVDALTAIRNLVTLRRVHQIVDGALAKVKEGKC